MAVRDFSILINLIKVSMKAPYLISLANCRNHQGAWLPNWTLPSLPWGPASPIFLHMPHPPWITPSPLPEQCLFLLCLPPSHLCHSTYYLMGPSPCHRHHHPAVGLSTFPTVSLFPPECLLYPSHILCALPHSMILLRLFLQLRMLLSLLSASSTLSSGFRSRFGASAMPSS